MKYYEVNFTIQVVPELLQDARDVLSAMAGEAGFETFEETADGVKGYVQQQAFDRDALDSLIADFPFGGDVVGYTACEAEDRDWNEQWEQEGFAPISIDLTRRANGGTLVIHDGRHLPDEPATIGIEIDARLAFGTGTHETTRMICTALTTLDMEGWRVLDCGTGTGILSICALKLGAASAVGYDIDEWSVDNARHNAVINRVDERFRSLLGDAGILEQVEGDFDLVVANINRNILLNDMPLMRKKMKAGGRLMLSGFYTADIPMLAAKAESLGLQVTDSYEEKDWACIVLQAQ